MDKIKITDEELVRLTLQDKNHFSEIIFRYETKLMRYLRRLLNINQETAEDLLQDIFIKTYRNLNGFDQSLKFSSWIYRIAHNEAISHYRQFQKNKQIVSIDEANGLLEIMRGTLETDRETLNNELTLRIKTVIDALPSKYREILILKFIEEKDYEEIADILKIPAGTVGTLIHRGKTALKQLAQDNKLDDFL